MIVGGAFAFVLVTITELRGTTDLRRQTREELVAADTVEAHIIDVETGLRGFVITRDASFLQPSSDARAALPASARALERLAADEPVQLARVRRIVAAMNAYLQQYARPLVLAVRRDEPSVRSVERTLAGKQRVDALRQGLSSFREAERARLAVRDADVDNASRRATAAAAVGVGGSILLILLFAGYLTRVIVHPLRRAGLLADRLAGGDLSARMRESDIAEIGALERSFNVMAGSLEKSRTELASLLAEQAALRRVATLVARESSPADVFVRVAEEVASVLGDVDCGLVRDEGDGTASAVAVWGGTASAAFSVGARLPLDGDGVIASVLREGRPYRIADYSAATGTLTERAREIGVRAAVGCPIVVGGRTWGAMAVAGYAAEPFPPETESRIAQFSELVATAIANADARAEVERLLEEQAALRRVATLVAQGVQPADIFSAVSEEVSQLFGTDLAGVGKLDPDGPAHVVLGLAKSIEGVTIGSRWELDDLMAVTEVYGTGRSARIDRTDWSAVDAPSGEVARRLGTVSAVASPIVVEGGLWGAITVTATEPLPLHTEERLEKFTGLVATAIANAESREALRQLADEQAALRRVATLVAEGAAPASVFDAVAAEMERLLDAEQVSLGRYEPGDELTVVAHRGPNTWRLPPGSRLSHEGENVSVMVRRTERPARMEDFEDAPGSIAQIVRAMGMRLSVGAPIVVDGRLWGVITARWSGEDPPPADTEDRMAQFAELLDTAIANADIRDQLTASRARLLTEGDEARRRLVRDLHDGAQQRLVHGIITLKLAQRALGENDAQADSLVGEALAHVEQGNMQLRDLAHGILPEVLTRGGLRAGVDAVVAGLDLPVEVDVPAERFPGPIEASAYFIVAEALTNVVKHARAGRAEVTAFVQDGMLHVAVRDDGVGGADPNGHGLVGIHDRVTALGGRLKIESPASDGTLVTATLPLSAA